MAKDHSFDIVSQVDFMEVTNALDQTRKEVAQRYDFRGSVTTVDWDKEKETLTLKADSEMRLKALNDVLQTKLTKRQVSLKSLEYKPVERAAGGAVRQEIKVQNGIPQEKCKIITKFIKETKLKTQPSIQEDKIRVQAGKIDLLQELIKLLQGKDFGIDLQFINYR
jgi:hypothetical protein